MIKMINKIKKGIRFPEAVKRRVAASIVRPFVNGSFGSTRFPNRDWDTLIVLDACRYDTFEQLNPFDRNPEPFHSNASHTTDFLEANFSDPQLDTVYVSATPQIAGYEFSFADVFNLWEDLWDETLRTVTPETVTEEAFRAAEQYPNKRLVVHYMQPHYPFIGPTGRDLQPHATYTRGQREREHFSVWELLSAGKVDREIVETAYQENLEEALPHVQELVDGLAGKTVITSDHGNLFGERVSVLPLRLYGHPSGIPHENLVTVPWLELPFETRRTIQSNQEATVNNDSEVATDRLEDLGYL